MTYRLLFVCLLVTVFSAQEKWNYSADEMEQIKVYGQTIRRLKHNVRFIKKDQVIFTDNAVQHITDDILYMNGNTKMINGMDTLTCDSMIYWSKLDSIHAFNALIKNPTRGMFGDEMIIQYVDSFIKQINVSSNAFAYNDLNVQIEESGPYRYFRDEMSSKTMTAHFSDDEITQRKLKNMTTTLYHIINDSLLSGNNEASGDSILIDFHSGNIRRIQVFGGALGEYKPEGTSTKIDTIIHYGARIDPLMS